jgi:membrane-associated protease RseP (regulator of RpoE activity)
MDLNAVAPVPPASPSSPAPPPAEGALLDSVLDDTPAGRAGLKPGDRVVALNGQPIRDPYDLTDHLDRTPADAEVTIEYLRGPSPRNRPRSLTLRTAHRPKSSTPKLSSTGGAPTPPKGKADDLLLTLPKEVIERIGRLERRVEELEKNEKSTAP